jgi:hypothetical protein
MIKELLFKKKAPQAARPQDLAALEAKLGVRFPPAFVEFCCRWNGGFPANTNNFYPVPGTFTEFHDEYKKSKGIIADMLFGATDEFPQCSLNRECTRVLGEFSKLIIPVTADLFGNHAVLRADSPMGMVYWSDHELWEVPENPPPGPNFAERPRLIPIAPDLETFYNSLLADIK